MTEVTSPPETASPETSPPETSPPARAARLRDAWRRWRRARALLLALCLVALGASSLALAEVTHVPARLLAPGGYHADVLVVPTGDPGGLRTRAASRAFADGLAPRMLITGTGAGEDSSANLARLAEREGVPADRIVTEEHSLNTFENMRFSWPLVAQMGAKRALLVTSRAHARRASMLAEQAWPGVEVKVMPVEAGDTGLRPRAVEAIKTLRYAWLGRLTWKAALLGGGKT